MVVNLIPTASTCFMSVEDIIKSYLYTKAASPKAKSNHDMLLLKRVDF